MLRTGESIGPYTLTNKLGQGAFGAVWLAERRTSITTTKVALKSPLSDEIDLNAIKQEADLWVQASGHPNVIPIIEANVYDGRVVIVSEYAPGGTLAEWQVRFRGSSPPLTTVVEIISGILSGLEHLHARNIIHRDLKPANILLQGEIPRLTDFGISRILKTTSQSSNFAGTPVYMAPEAFDGKRSPQTDLWAVGVMFYELLAGRLPFPQMDFTSLVGAVISRNPDPLPASVPIPIQEIVFRALQKNPAQRYGSAAEMRAALRRAMQGRQTNSQILNAPTVISNTLPSPPSPAPAPLPAPPSAQPTKQGLAPHYVYAATALLMAVILGGVMIFLLKPKSNETLSANGLNLQNKQVESSPAPTSPPPSPTPTPRTISPFQNAEAKILNGYALFQADLTGLSSDDLRLLRNTVFARHGRLFQTPEIQRYFDGRAWYTRRLNYDNADLTANDQANVKLLQGTDKY